MTLALEQMLNGIQFGVMLFLLAAGLTLIFGVMGIINLAHGAFYMIGAYGAAWWGTNRLIRARRARRSRGGAIAGLIIEFVVIRRLYSRDHVQQVLATFGVILLVNEGTTILFGRQPLYLPSLACYPAPCRSFRACRIPSIASRPSRPGSGRGRAVAVYQQDPDRDAGARWVYAS